MHKNIITVDITDKKSLESFSKKVNENKITLDDEVLLTLGYMESLSDFVKNALSMLLKTPKNLLEKDFIRIDRDSVFKDKDINVKSVKLLRGDVFEIKFNVNAVPEYVNKNYNGEDILVRGTPNEIHGLMEAQINGGIEQYQKRLKETPEGQKRNKEINTKLELERKEKNEWYRNGLNPLIDSILEIKATDKASVELVLKNLFSMVDNYTNDGNILPNDLIKRNQSAIEHLAELGLYIKGISRNDLEKNHGADSGYLNYAVGIISYNYSVISGVNRPAWPQINNWIEKYGN